MLTTEDRVNIVLLMAKYESPTLVERHLKKEGASTIPTHKTMRSIFDKFIETGSVVDAPRCGRPRRSDEKIEEIKDIFEENPSTSIRQAAAIADTSFTTVTNVLCEDLRIKPFSFCYQLFDDDKAATVTMCNKFQERIAADDNSLFLRRSNLSP